MGLLTAILAAGLCLAPAGGLLPARAYAEGGPQAVVAAATPAANGPAPADDTLELWILAGAAGLLAVLESGSLLLSARTRW